MLIVNIRDDERAQGGAELLLIFGGIIVIAIIVIIVYRNYTGALGNETNSDVQSVTGNITAMKNKF